MSSTTDETCLLCVQQEAARLISLCMDLGLDLKTREDVRNLIMVSEYLPLYKDPAFIESVIDIFLETA